MALGDEYRDGTNRTISCVPSSDAAFCQTVTATMAEIEDTVAGDEFAAVLVGRLRDSYPLAVVHRQNPLGRIVDEDRWYVYRDNRPLTATDLFADELHHPLLRD